MRQRVSGDDRLPGYRRCASEDAARAELAREVLRHIADGMKPADDAARAIADAAPAPSTRASTELPIRQDFYVYNEAGGFMLTSRRMAGRPLMEDDAAWQRSVTKGEILPITLVQDDPFIVRMVVGGALEEAELEEWVARVDWHLNVPDGKLVITGGGVLVSDEYDEDDVYYRDYVRDLAIPKGRYRASVYTYVHGVNGDAPLDQLAGGYGKAEPMEEWFARTRPGETPADWENGEMIGFLVHLTPIDEVPRDGLSTIEPDTGGWFGMSENARKPALCPRGIFARDVQGHLEESEGKWLYVHDTFGPHEGRALESLRGGPVTVAPSTFSHVARLAWLCARFAGHEWRATLPTGATVDLGGALPEGVVALQDGARVELLFSNDLHPVGQLRAIDALASRLAALPEGTTLELCSAPPPDMPGTEIDAGIHRYRGVMRGGTWHLDATSPALDATTLREALAFVAELETRDEVGEKGIAEFIERFSAAWPIAPLPSDEDDNDFDEEPAEPIRGAVVFTAPSGRIYQQSMALMLSEAIAERIFKEERALFGAGFKHVADLVCDAFAQIIVRSYARPGGTAWASFLVAAPEIVKFELSTRFERDNASLLTGMEPQVRDLTATRSYRQGFADEGPKALVVRHEARVAELEVVHGPAIVLTTTAAGLAGDIEASLLKQGYR